MQVQYDVPCTHQDNIQHDAKRSAIKAGKFLQSLFISDPSSWSGLQAHWQDVNIIFHKAPQEELKGVRSGDCRGQEVNPPQQIHHSGTCLFKNVVT
jgi:hypothetical protein